MELASFPAADVIKKRISQAPPATVFFLFAGYALKVWVPLAYSPRLAVNGMLNLARL